MLNNLKVRIKIFIIAGILLLLLIACAALGYVNLKKANENVMTMYNVNLMKTQLIIDSRTQQRAIEADFYSLILHIGDADKQKELIKDIDTRKETFNSNIEKIKAIGFDKAEQEKMTVLSENLLLLRAGRDKAVQLALEGKKEESLSMFSSVEPSLTIIQATLRDLTKDQLTDAENRDKANDAAYVNAERSFIILILISLLFGIATTFVISNNITVALSESVKFIKKVADGDLSGHVEQKYINRKDEIGDLTKAAEIMATGLNSVVLKIRENSTMVNSATSGLKKSAEETGRAAEEVAITMQSVAEEVTKASMTVSDVTDIIGVLDRVSIEVTNAAEGTLISANKSTESANTGVVSLEKAISQLDIVNKTVSFATDAVKNLSKRSSEIGNITSVIRGIASQTNMLALNASIEAARAGEAGKGFAVVSNEIKKLAEGSAKASEDIVSLIEDIVSETRVTIQSMEFNEGEVKKQVDLITGAGALIKDMAYSLAETKVVAENSKIIGNELKRSTENLSKAVKELANLMSQNAAASEEVAAATEEQTATVEEISASAHELNEMADDLQALVKKFIV